MDLIETALAIALKAYKGQKDKAGKSYILHPLRLMAKMQTEDEMATAILHDVIEDSDYTRAALINEGIPANIAKAVEVLSKTKGENYDQFIDRVSGNPLALSVKIADIEDNINILRLASITDKDLQRVAKYHRAWHTLHSRMKGLPT